jgi:RNA polymerase sigma-70 factor (ECF subfamily)
VKAPLAADSDAALAARAASGDDRAFTELVGRYKQALFRVVYRVAGNEDDAREILQEAFVAAHRALRRYDPARPMQAWLTTIALNKARDWRRRETVRRMLRAVLPAAVAVDVPDSAAPVDVMAADRQELALVQARIATLPPNLQQVLVLRTLEGLSQAETAAILGVSEKAVETRLYRARQQLAAALER